MLSRIKKKILNYFFVRFEIFEQNKKSREKLILMSQFEKVGKNLFIGNDYIINNPSHIEIGNDFSAGRRFRVEAIRNYNNQVFIPKIVIGENVNIGTDMHIACINRIQIKDNCLFGSRILITDHQHGDTSQTCLDLPPKERELISKGPVLIEENVWIGDGVVIMPNVKIGNNSIIAANAVVTSNVEPYSIMAGVPARKIINKIS